MMLKLLLFVFAVVSAGKLEHKDFVAPAKYTYSYGVEDFKTGDYKMHKEEREGDVVKGEYTVADPDGSIRTVTYTADEKNGFQAIVKRTGGHDGSKLAETAKYGDVSQEDSSKSDETDGYLSQPKYDESEQGGTYEPVQFVQNNNAHSEQNAVAKETQYLGSPKFRVLNLKSAELSQENAQSESSKSAEEGVNQISYDDYQNVQVQTNSPQLHYQQVLYQDAYKQGLGQQNGVSYQPQYAYQTGELQNVQHLNAKQTEDVKLNDQQSQISYYNEQSVQPAHYQSSGNAQQVQYIYLPENLQTQYQQNLLKNANVQQTNLYYVTKPEAGVAQSYPNGKQATYSPENVYQQFTYVPQVQSQEISKQNVADFLKGIQLQGNYQSGAGKVYENQNYYQVPQFQKYTIVQNGQIPSNSVQQVQHHQYVKDQ